MKENENLNDHIQDMDIKENEHSNEHIPGTDIQNENKKIDNEENSREKSNELPQWARVEKYLKSVYEFQYNEVANRIEIRFLYDPPSSFKEANPNNLLRELCLNRFNFPLEKVKALLRSDFVKTINPFREYFKSLTPWNKDSDPNYIKELADYVILKNPDNKKAFITQFEKMLVRTVKCAIDDNYYNKHAFIIVGPKQHTGKTYFMMFLGPEKLKEYTASNLHINDKDNEIALSSNIMINMDELSDLQKMEQNKLKQYLSTGITKLRRPYEAKETVTPRRASFFGTTNSTEFLSDETGSVRWICFEIEYIDWNNKEKGNYSKNISIDDIWRQAFHLLKEPEFNCELTYEEIQENENRNDAYQKTTIERQLIQKYFKPGTTLDHTDFFTSDEIGDQLKICSISYTKINLQAIGKALHYLKFPRISKYSEKKGWPVYGYYVIYENPTKPINKYEPF